MWRKFPLVCSNYCLQRIAIPPEKRRGREKETKKKRLHSENNYFVPNCHSAPANKNFPSQRKMLGKVSAKRCIWDLAFKQVSCNISNFMNIGFGTFGRWHQVWNKLRLSFSLFGCEYTIISPFCNVLFFSQFQESLNIKSVRFNREGVWFLSQLC